MDKPTIFISHISEEAALATWLKKQLLETFLNHPAIFVSSDGNTIQAGAIWLDELSNSLQKAQVGLVLCSQESVTRPWVNFEAGAIWLRGILLVPICHSNLSPRA